MSRSSKGQNLIEALVGLVVIIPLGLGAIDLIAVVTAVDNNEHIADTAARAAATQPDQAAANRAAEDVLSRCQTSWMVSTISIDKVVYNQAKGVVNVSTLIDLKLPVPLPGMTSMRFKADSAEPIVETPAAK